MDLDDFKPFKDCLCLCIGVSVNEPLTIQKKVTERSVFPLHPSKSLCTTEVKENSRDKYSRLTRIMKLWAMTGE